VGGRRAWVDRARPALLAVLLAPLGLAAPRADADLAVAPPPPFAEEMVVHEVALVADLSRQAAPPSLVSLLVREDGQPRAVVKIESLAPPRVAGRTAVRGAPPWDLVLYFDRLLADSETVGHAAIALAKAAPALTDAGAVQVVVADPAPRELLAATREPMLLEETLAALAGQARSEASRIGSRSLPELERQTDRLVTFLAAREGPLPRALFLIAGSRVPVTPADHELLAAAGGAVRYGRPPLPPSPLSRTVLEAAQVLASYGWITCPMSGRRQSGEISFFRPQLAPLSAFARLTAGQFLDDDRQVGSFLRRLQSRWLLWYQTPAPRDGRVRPVEVWLDGRQQPWAPKWVRSATPLAVTEARLRNALAGDNEPSPLALAVRYHAVHGGTAVDLRLTPPPNTAGQAAGPVRVSFAHLDATPADVEFDHREEARGLRGPVWTWSGVVPVQDLCGPLAVEVEDLGLGVRAAVAIRPPAAERAAACAPLRPVQDTGSLTCP
jgi:hypothetical protein